jgi:hypothetical protein
MTKLPQTVHLRIGDIPSSEETCVVAKKPCRIHYRKLTRNNGSFPDVPLHERITAALNSTVADGSQIRSRVGNRVAASPNQPGYQRTFNNYQVGDGYVFGTTCLFAPGEMQALLRLSGNEEQADLAAVLEAFEISEQRAPDGHEYLHGITYWTAIGDHFYQIQHVALQSGAMEQYLTWLLRDQAKVIAPQQFVTLQSVFDREQLGDEDVNFIQIGGIVPETLRAEPAGQPQETPAPDDMARVVEVEERERLGGGLLGFDKGKKILEELYGDVRAQQMLDAVPAEASLEVSVNIGFRSKRRKLQKQFMNDLAAGLRNLPDGEVTVRTRNGTSKGADARLFLDLSIQRVSDTSGLLVLDDARDQMLEVHRRFLHDGKIEP